MVQAHMESFRNSQGLGRQGKTRLFFSCFWKKPGSLEANFHCCLVTEMQARLHLSVCGVAVSGCVPAAEELCSDPGCRAGSQRPQALLCLLAGGTSTRGPRLWVLHLPLPPPECWMVPEPVPSAHIPSPSVPQQMWPRSMIWCEQDSCKIPVGPSPILCPFSSPRSPGH